MRVTRSAIFFLFIAGTTLASFAGCSSILRETRLVYDSKNPGWTKDSLDFDGFYNVECTRGRVTLKIPGILDSRLMIKRIGPPGVPLIPITRSSDLRNKPIWTGVTVSSPRDTTVIDLREISLHVSGDSVIHPYRWLNPGDDVGDSNQFRAADTTSWLGLGFEPMAEPLIVRLDLGHVRVNGIEMIWPVITYRRDTSSHYYFATDPEPQ